MHHAVCSLLLSSEVYVLSSPQLACLHYWNVCHANSCFLLHWAADVVHLDNSRRCAAKPHQDLHLMLMAAFPSERSVTLDGFAAGRRTRRIEGILIITL